MGLWLRMWLWVPSHHGVLLVCLLFLFVPPSLIDLAPRQLAERGRPMPRAVHLFALSFACFIGFIRILNTCIGNALPSCDWRSGVAFLRGQYHQPYYPSAIPQHQPPPLLPLTPSYRSQPPSPKATAGKRRRRTRTASAAPAPLTSSWTCWSTWRCPTGQRRGQGAAACLVGSRSGCCPPVTRAGRPWWLPSRSTRCGAVCMRHTWDIAAQRALPHSKGDGSRGLPLYTPQTVEASLVYCKSPLRSLCATLPTPGTPTHTHPLFLRTVGVPCDCRAASVQATDLLPAFQSNAPDL